jgi:hypothetical protein
MQKFFFFICVFVSFLLSIQSYAAVITVDANHPSAGMYKNLKDAHDAANSGDTILVYPFAGSYNAIDVTKKLKIIGRGWYHVPISNLSTTISGTMQFLPGSGGSSLEGFRHAFWVTIDANNITIKRNDLDHIEVQSNHTGSVIIQNLFDTYLIDSLINVFNDNDIFIANNIFINRIDNYGGTFGIHASSNTISINIIYNYMSIGRFYALTLDSSNYSVTNNIIANGDVSPKTSLGFSNNISNSDQLKTSNGNMINVNMSTVYGNSYKLIENSPAIGAGTNGTDIGIYGGSTPFVLGGYPSIPRIVDIEADHLGTKSHGLDVKIKATTVRE